MNAKQTPEVAIIIGGGPGISASCARLFANNGMQVVVAARNPDKTVLKELASKHDVRCIGCDAQDPSQVNDLFQTVNDELGRPKLVVHNIDGRVPDIFRKQITEADPELALNTLRNSAYSAFLVGQQAARHMLQDSSSEESSHHKGTIIFTNASGAFKGYAKSGAFAMACHAKAGLAQSMARELMPQGIHMSHMFPSMQLSVGHSLMALEPTEWREQPWTKTWQTLTISRTCICIYTVNHRQPGRSKLCYGPGWKHGSVQPTNSESIKVKHGSKALRN